MRSRLDQYGKLAIFNSLFGLINLKWLNKMNVKFGEKL